MVFLWPFLRWFLVTSFPDKLRFLNSPAAFNQKPFIREQHFFLYSGAAQNKICIQKQHLFT
jgi:hypothetical protein